MTKAMPDLIRRWPRGYYYLSDQLKRAMTSIVLNIAEGNARRSSLERKRFFDISMASSSEVSSIIEIATAYNLMDKSRALYYQDILLQIYKILYKLR
jgi:four helix bundle protein